MTEATFPPAAQERLKAYLGRPGFKIPVGLGNEEAACSIAAINIAISGQFTARIPECMSKVIGKWIITTCLLYTSPSPRDRQKSRMPSSA